MGKIVSKLIDCCWSRNKNVDLLSDNLEYDYSKLNDFELGNNIKHYILKHKNISI